MYIRIYAYTFLHIYVYTYTSRLVSWGLSEALLQKLFFWVSWLKHRCYGRDSCKKLAGLFWL